MARRVNIAPRISGLDQRRRLVGTRPHEALDRGIGEAVALAAGQFAGGNGRRGGRDRYAGGEQEANDRVQVIHARLVASRLAPARGRPSPADQRVRTSTSPSTPVMTL